MKRKTIVCAIMLSTLMAGSLITAIHSNSGNFVARGDSTYTMTLSNQNKITSEEATNETFTRTTQYGNDVEFKTSGTISTTGFALLEQDEYIVNQSDISGLSKVKITSDSNSIGSIFYLNYGYSEYTCLNVLGPYTVSASDLVFDISIPNGNFFKLYNTTSATLNVSSLEISYSCNKSLPTNKGVAYSKAQDYTLNKSVDDYRYVIFEYCVNDGEYFNLSLMGRGWDNYYGYYEFGKFGPVSTYVGIYSEPQTDGYIKITMYIRELNRTNSDFNLNHTPDGIGRFYIRGSTSNAAGYLANIEFTNSGDVNRGTPFYAGIDKQFNAPSAGRYARVSFEYKLLDSTKHLNLMVGNWDSYYGYFGLYVNGPSSTYDGVYTTLLPDGYVYVEIILQEVIRINNDNTTPDPGIDVKFLYIRGGWTDGDGYIEHVEFSGYEFEATKDVHVTLTPRNDVRYVIFEYKLTTDGNISVAVGNSGLSKYYGNYNFKIGGAGDAYKGIYLETLEDGFIRVTLNIPELNRTNASWNMDNVPEEVTEFFIRGSWSTAAGSVDKIAFTNKANVNRGQAFNANADTTIKVTPGSYSKISFDYKMTSATGQITFMVGNWSKYYGYYKLDKESLNQVYTGITATYLPDKYVHVEMDLTLANKFDGGAGTNPELHIEFLYMRGTYTTASGYIDNIQLTPAE